jgi:hypothetical protein
MKPFIFTIPGTGSDLPAPAVPKPEVNPVERLLRILDGLIEAYGVLLAVPCVCTHRPHVGQQCSQCGCMTYECDVRRFPRGHI